MSGSTVVHLFGTLDRGGAETRLLDELRARPGRERHVLVALSGRAGALDDDFRALGAEVVHQRLGATFPWSLLRLLRRRGATHLHSHVQLTSAWFLLVARAAGVPRRIAHLHSVGDGRPATPGRRAYRAASHLALALGATDVVAVSAAVRDAVARRDPWLRRRTVVLFDRVDGARFTLAPAVGAEAEADVGPGDGPLRLVAVGRLDDEKDPLRLVGLVAALAGRGVDARLQLVGLATEAQGRAVDERAAALGVAGRVERLGARDDVPARLAASHVLLSASHREGLPGAVLESAAAGIPAVVSAIEANEEAARWLAGVVPVPLAAADDVWCDVIVDVAAARTGRLAPASLRAGFDRSPFALGDPSALDALWS